jgi:hypothetical protein
MDIGEYRACSYEKNVKEAFWRVVILPLSAVVRHCRQGLIVDIDDSCE